MLGSNGYKVEANHKMQPNNTTKVLYKPLILLKASFKTIKYFYKYVTKWSASLIKVGVVYIHVLRHLKEELVWAID